MPFRIGIIGTGQIAQRGHLPGLLADGRCEVVAISARNPERLQKVAGSFGISAYYTDWREMLALERLDAATIATPPIHHREMAVEAMEHGLDVLIEKPLATSINDAQEIVETAQKTGRIAMVEQSLRYNPAFRKSCELVKSGAIGKIKRIHGAMLHSGPKGWAPESNWFFDPKIAGGGVILDSGVHIVDIIRYITQANFADLNGELVYSYNSQIEEEASLTGWLQGDIQVAIELSWHVNPSQVSVNLYGTEGNLHVDIKSAQPIKIFYRNGDISIPLVQSDWYGNVWKHFVEVCENREEPVSSVSDNVHSLVPLLSLYGKSTTRRHLSKILEI